MSTYSLVKPHRGSNVMDDQIVNLLLTIEKVVPNVDERSQQSDDQIGAILDRASNIEELGNEAYILDEHEYFKYTTSDYVIEYISA